jgi:hypothetical protein
LGSFFPEREGSTGLVYDRFHNGVVGNLSHIMKNCIRILLL